MQSFKKDSEKFLLDIFEVSQHGSPEHRAWLKEKLLFFSVDLQELLSEAFYEGHAEGVMETLYNK